MFVELILLLSAGFVGGFINSVAGGGSFVTFPALLFSGIPPVLANATNTFAACAGYLSGAYAFRNELRAHKNALWHILPISLIGGALGAWLLLQIPEAAFKAVVPWLLLFATVMFVFGPKVNAALKQAASGHHHISKLGSYTLLLLLLLVCAYGGFFNAGLGIVALSYLALAGYRDINSMNGLKLLISTAASLTAIIIFVIEGAVVWSEGTILLVGSLLGGYVAANVSKAIPAAYVKRFVVLIGGGMTTYFFVQA